MNYVTLQFLKYILLSLNEKYNKMGKLDKLSNIKELKLCPNIKVTKSCFTKIQIS